MSPMLKPCGLQLGPKWPLGPSCGMLEPSWAEVGAKWVRAGWKLGPCWPKLAPSGADVVAMSDRNGAFGRCWADLKNWQITAVPCNLATSPAQTCPPPAVSCTNLTEGSVRSYPSLLSYHASVPSDVTWTSHSSGSIWIQLQH